MLQNDILIFLRVLFITMGYLYVGYALTYYAIIQNSIAYVMRFQDSSYLSEIEGFINAMLPIGAAIAALLSASIANKLRFRATFICVDIFGIVVALLFTWPNFYVLIITRGLQGFITGINSALVIQYIYHLVKLKNVGFFVGLGPSIMMLGLTLGFLVQWIVIKEDPQEFNQNTNYGYLGFNNWKLIFLLTAVPCLIRLIGMFTLLKNDLPFEQIKQGNEEMARTLIINSNPNSTDDEISQLFTSIQENLKQEKQSIKDLFSKKYQKSTLICITFSIFQQFAGINAVNFYAGVVVGAMTQNNNTIINMANVCNGLVSLCASFFSSIMINKFGRRIILLIGNAFCFFSLTVNCILISDSKADNLTYQVLNLIFLFIFIISYSLSLGPVFWVYLSEVMPTYGISLVTFINWMSCAALAQIFPIISKHQSLQFNFGLFALVCFILQIFLYCFVFETKGLTKAEIQMRFRKQKKYIDISD